MFVYVMNGVGSFLGDRKAHFIHKNFYVLEENPSLFQDWHEIHLNIPKMHLHSNTPLEFLFHLILGLDAIFGLL